VGMINWNIAEPICNKCEDKIDVYETEGFFEGVLIGKACINQSSIDKYVFLHKAVLQCEKQKK
jgi:hypothetical protein